MHMATKTDIFAEHLTAWLAVARDKKKRGGMVRHLCFVTGMHPKSIPRSFKRVQLRSGFRIEQRGRKVYYTPDVSAALMEIWQIAGEPCGDNLHAVIPEYVRILTRDGDWSHSLLTTQKLLAMSLGTVKKRVPRFSRQLFPVHGASTTTRGAIHAHIPIRTGPWSLAPIGTMQLDTVAHCGSSVAGDFIYTVNTTDVATLWGARRAQWNKGQQATVISMAALAEAVPVPIVEWHPDSGSEFINWHCVRWCQERHERLTRSRPNHKNDNCFVEERNGHVIRRWVGYARLDAPEVVEALNAVYDVLTPYLNHFVASKRIVSKERYGSQWRIIREHTAKTPYQRILERTDVAPLVKAQLIAEHEQLNPLQLKQEIDHRLELMFTVHRQHGTPTSQEGLR